MQWAVPVAHVHCRLSSATGLALRLGQFNGALAPQVSQSDGFDERVWDAHDVPALRKEAGVPKSFDPWPWVEWSDFATWGDVARWAEPLYQVPTRLSPVLRAAVDGIAHDSPQGEARIVAVLRLVQQQVRYLGVEIGAGTHSPSAPRRRLRAALGRLQGEGAADGDDAARARHRGEPGAGEHRSPRLRA